MLFDNWDTVVRTALVGILAYVAIVLLLRISGKRTLSKWNAFDFVVTIALGSSLATTILSKSTSLTQGVIAFTVLILLQLAITWLSVRFSVVQRIVKAKPTLLLYRGAFRDEALRRERVTESEVRAALRAQGISDVGQVGAVILETDGSFSVGPENSTLVDVEGIPEPAPGAASG
jgi:uncharacterized membrane protein YcaP (DUF421 family)